MKLYEREDLSMRMLKVEEYVFARQDKKDEISEQIAKDLTSFEPEIKKVITETDKKEAVDKILVKRNK